LLDCGPGIATAISGAGGAGSLDAIVISHLHPDHCYDLLPVGTTMRRVTRPAPLPLYAPVGTRDLLHKLAQVFPLGPAAGRGIPFYDAFAISEYRPGDTIRVGDCTLTMHLLRHAVPNCGIKITTSQATMAYTGDTGPTDAARSLADGVDLLLAEATLADTDTGDYGHLCAADAALIAAEARAGQLVLTHLGSASPAWAQARLTEASRIFAGPIHLAQPGARYQVPCPGSGVTCIS
jgi:ribonuclease BN (tRNA processing enzyme)